MHHAVFLSDGKPGDHMAESVLAELQIHEGRQPRREMTVLVLAPGFELRAQPRQVEELRRGGWRVREC